MNKTVDVRQIEVALTVRQDNPTILNLESLQGMSVVPIDWGLSQAPTYTKDMSLIAFQNGIYILHRGNLVAFLEDVGEKHLEELNVPQIVHRYLEKFPNVNYQAVDINIEGYTAFEAEDEARNYLLEMLLASAHCHESDQKIVQAAANLIYRLDRGLFTLTVRNTELEFLEGGSVALIAFSANFHRDIADVSGKEQLCVLSQIVQNWQTDIETYRQVVNKRFLSAKTGSLNHE